MAVFENDVKNDANLIYKTIQTFGYDITYEQVLEFLSDKDKKNKFKISNTVNEVPKKLINHDSTKSKFYNKIKELGYSFSDSVLNEALNNLSEEYLYKLQEAFDTNKFIKNKNYLDFFLFDNYFIERLFSIIDFFGLKKSGEYEEILKQRGKLYFRVKPDDKSVYYSADSFNYGGIYELVLYKNKEYLILRKHGDSQIVYLPEQIFKSELTNLEEYLQNFEYVGKRTYRPNKYTGPDKRYLGENHPKVNVNKLYVIYKSDKLLITKHKFPKRDISLCEIRQGDYYTDGSWQYEDADKEEYVSLSLPSAINEIYGKKIK